MHVADRFDVGQDTGADHERQHVHCHEQRGAHGERHQHLRRDLLVRVQLDLHHGHLNNKTITVHETVSAFSFAGMVRQHALHHRLF